MSTTNRWGTTDPIEAEAGASTIRTPRVVLATDSMVRVINTTAIPVSAVLAPLGANQVFHAALTPDQVEAAADVAERLTRQTITIQNTGVDVLRVALGENTAGGTRGLDLKACAVAGDGTGGLYTTRSGLAIWIYARTVVAPAAQVEEEYV